MRLLLVWFTRWRSPETLLRVVDSDQRGRASGAFQGGFLLGGVAGPAVGGLVVAWSIRAPFFVYAATLLLAAGWVVRPTQKACGIQETIAEQDRKSVV